MTGVHQPDAVDPVTLEFQRANSVERRTEVLTRLDFALCFCLFFALIFNPIIGRLTPLMVLGFVGAYGLMHRWLLWKIFKVSWPILLLPAFALMSYLWSISPGNTLRYGLYFLLSVFAATFVGAGMRKEIFLQALFWVLCLHMVLGVLDGTFVGIGGTGQMAFVGIQGSKNQSGQFAAVTVLTSLVALAYAKTEGSPLLFWSACLTFIVSIVLLLLSRATGATIACAVALICVIAWLISRRMATQTRGAIFVTVLVTVVTLLLTADYWLPALFDFVLENTGKDKGLTGRDLIWSKAEDLIERRPVIGLGYNAFWVDGNLDAKQILREMNVDDPRGFNFHNAYLEVVVHLGYLGLALFGTIMLTCIMFLIFRALREAAYPLILACGLLVFLMMMLPFESFAFGGMQLLSVLTYTILVMGLSAPLKAKDKTNWQSI